MFYFFLIFSLYGLQASPQFLSPQFLNSKGTSFAQTELVEEEESIVEDDEENASDDTSQIAFDKSSGFARPNVSEEKTPAFTQVYSHDDPDIDPDIDALGRRVHTFSKPKEDEQIFTLQDAINAMLSDSRMAALLSDLGASCTQARSARIHFLPEISAKASTTTFRSTPTENSLDRSNNHDRASYGLEARYGLFKGFSDLNNYKASKISAEIAKLSALEKIGENLTEIIKLYTQSIASNNVRLVQERKLLLANEALKVAQERFRLGDITEADLESARASIAQARSDCEKAKADAFRERCQLENATGCDLTGKALAPLSVPDIFPDSLNECIDITLKKNPVIQRAALTSKILRLQLSASRGRFMPSVSAFAKIDRMHDTSWMGSNKPDEPRITNDLSAGLEVNLPIDYRGAIADETRQVAYKVEKEIATLRYTRRQVISQIKILWNLFHNSQKTIAHLEASVRAAAAAWKAYREGYEQGTKIAVELLQSEKDYIAAEVELIRARQDRIFRAFELLHHTGLLTSTFLGDKVPTQTQKSLNFIRNMGKKSDDHS